MLTEDVADMIWSILIEDAGASISDSERRYFIRHQCNYDMEKWGSSEFRFQGKLGFGGKLWRTPWPGRWYVSCYKEDENPERIEAIRITNERLASLKAEYSEQL